jgi:hypothetical protein
MFEIGAIESARPLIEEAVQRSPLNPEAHYYLGLIRDEQGATADATRAFLRSRDLDLGQPAPAWTLTRETFEGEVKKALAALDDSLRAFVREDEIYVCDVPGVELVVDGVDPRALLLLDAVNLPQQPSAPSARLFAYQRNVERLAGAVEFVEEEVRAALEREITSAFLEPDQDKPVDPTTLN